MKTAAQKALLKKIANEHSYNTWGELMDDSHDVHKEDCTLEALNEWVSLQLQERWISVKDRLPEEDAIVLVAFQWHENPLTTMEAFYTKEDQFKRKDMFIIDSAFFPVDNITHWQPIPSPPKLQSPTG